MESFGSSFYLFIYGRVSLAMEGKSVMRMEITYVDYGGYIHVDAYWYASTF